MGGEQGDIQEEVEEGGVGDQDYKQKEVEVRGGNRMINRRRLRQGGGGVDQDDKQGVYEIFNNETRKLGSYTCPRDIYLSIDLSIKLSVI